MQSVIKELWHGNICPQENGVCNTPEIQELHHRLSEIGAELENALTEDQLQLLYKYKIVRDDYQIASEAEAFAYGYKLGTSIAVESLYQGQLIEKQ